MSIKSQSLELQEHIKQVYLATNAQCLSKCDQKFIRIWNPCDAVVGQFRTLLTEKEQIQKYKCRQYSIQI